MDMEILFNQNSVTRFDELNLKIATFIFRINQLILRTGIHDFYNITIGYKNYIYHKVRLFKHSIILNPGHYLNNFFFKALEHLAFIKFNIKSVNFEILIKTKGIIYTILS